MMEGLYLLQFKKCDKAECCPTQNGALPPLVPSPVPTPKGDHYLPFDAIYGKVKTTEKDSPSLNESGKDPKKKNNQVIDFILNTVLTASCIKSFFCFVRYSINGYFLVYFEHDLY